MSSLARENRGVQILGISLACFNLALWFGVLPIRAFVDITTGRHADPLNPQSNPRIGFGVPELLVYFDPWLAGIVFPLVYTLGFAAIPFLKKTGKVEPGLRPGRAYSVIVLLLLIGFEMVWLFLIAASVFLRGPNWVIFWPGEPGDPHKVVPLNNVTLSQSFWIGWLGQSTDVMPWYVRELPGLVSFAAYFLAGMVLARILFRRTGRATPYWRWLALLMLIQIAALVPLKMLLLWVFNLKYWVYVPEYWVNV
jgi:hypothetical protein